MLAPRPALALLLAALPLAAGALLAQDPPSPPLAVVDVPDPAEVAPLTSPRPAVVKPARDPFRGPPALEGSAQLQPGVHGPAQAGPRMPALRLLGVVQVKGRPAGALLEVDQTVCVVRAGDLLSVELPGFAPAALHVLEVGRGRVQVAFAGEQREVR